MVRHKCDSCLFSIDVRGNILHTCLDTKNEYWKNERFIEWIMPHQILLWRHTLETCDPDPTFEISNPTIMMWDR